MKLIIASDIHGSAKYCRLLTAAYEREQAQNLLLLGDILYHGPRNPLPDEYLPAKVAELLKPLASRIICVRGNCDGEVDQMVLSFPVLSDYAVFYADGVRFVLSHGHKDAPPMETGDVYLTGHTHVPLKKYEPQGYLHLNPGSVSLPKENSPRGYILFDSGKFHFKDLDGNEYDSIEI